jgi:hypothetical protein
LKELSKEEIEDIRTEETAPPEDLGSMEAGVSGFGLGKLFISVNYISGLLLLAYFLIGLIGGISSEFQGEDIPSLVLSFFVGGICIGFAYAIQKRKKIGLYAVYAFLAIDFVSGVFILVEEGKGALSEGIAMVVGGVLWFIYFYKRRAWFDK